MNASETFSSNVSNATGVCRIGLPYCGKVSRTTRPFGSCGVIDTPVRRAEPPVPKETWRKFVNLLLAAAAFELAMGIRNLLALPSPANVIMFVLQGAMAAFFVGAWVVLRRRRAFNNQQSQRALAIGMSLLVIIPVEMALTGNAMLFANLCLVLVFAGATLTDTRLFVAVLSVLTGSWCVAISTRNDWSPSPAQQLALIAIALLLASALHTMHVWDRRNLTRAWDHALHNSMRDDLTALWNRRGVREVIAPMIGGMRSTGMGIVCIFVDIRGLKGVNDSFGHAAGDRLLRAVGQVLAQTQEQGMVPARWGGDEFCIFGPATLADPIALVDELRDRVREHAADVPGTWDLSFGWAVQEHVGADHVMEELVAAADDDMYRRRGQVGRY